MDIDNTDIIQHMDVKYWVKMTKTDGEYDDEDACSCPNTPLRGYVCEAEFAFPPYHRNHQYHHKQDIIGMKGRQAGQPGPIPPPKPARSHSSQQQIQPQQQQVKKTGF